MTTFVPRPPYSREELDRLYPKNLNLQLVQIVRDQSFETCASSTTVGVCEKSMVDIDNHSYFGMVLRPT